LPSRHQLRWAELRVGVTVLVALVTLAVLIILMTRTSGLFTPKFHLIAYFDDAGGLRPGAPVRLNGVDIGNVDSVRFLQSHAPTPVQVRMNISSKFLPGLHTDSTAKLTTAGVLGEVYVNIDSGFATGPRPQNDAVLPAKETIDLEDMVVAGQSTLQNIQALINRVNNILTPIEQGRGSIGKLINDETLYNRLNSTLAELQSVANKVSSGQGTIGKLLNDDTLYVKANNSVDKLNKIMDGIEQGQGTAGKLVKDPSLYNNANQAVAKVNNLMDSVNQGKGALGMMTRDEAFARKLDDTMTRLNSLVTKMDTGQGTAGKLMNDPSLYVNTNQMLVETRNLVSAIRQNPKKYLTIHFRIF
jgi:phospholipid/cholesterol/gamma-HCH transport system substrate-binding protein